MLKLFRLFKLPRISKNALVVGISFIHFACSSSDPNSAANPVTIPFAAPTSGESLSAALTTRTTDQQNFDVWLCSIDGASPVIANRLNSNGQGVEYDLLNDFAQSSFTWQAASFNSVTTTADNGTQNIIENIQFNDVGNQFTSLINESAELSCERRTQEAVGVSPAIVPDNTVSSNSLLYGGQPYALTHGFEEQFRFRPTVGDTHRASEFNVADGEFFVTTITTTTPVVQVWRPRSASVWLRVNLYSPGPDDFASATFEYEPDDTDEDGPLVSGRYFFQEAVLGVDINGDGDIESDDAEFLDVIAGSISVVKDSPITTFTFELNLENGVAVSGAFAGDFITITN